ncbi:MAG: DNA-directed RNA polymerase subunit omega [Acidobacteriota bacterium]|nr:DNA-directed RNA polymerase subunit omega [Acidobacteriota bacterium]
MNITDKTKSNGKSAVVDDEQKSEANSSFQLIIVAALRAKQLRRGARPRIEADPRKRRNTSIAIEEVKQGLVNFTAHTEVQPTNGAASKPGKR